MKQNDKPAPYQNRPAAPARTTVQEGTIKKGGTNVTYQISHRPGKPAPIKPADQATGSKPSK